MLLCPQGIVHCPSSTVNFYFFSPLDVFEFMYKQGVCTKQAGLYEAWAYQLELLASYKKADGVFSNGLKAVTDAEMKARLLAKQKQFQARVLRRVKGEGILSILARLNRVFTLFLIQVKRCLQLRRRRRRDLLWVS